MTHDFDTAIDQLNPLIRYLQRVKTIARIKRGDDRAVRAEERDALRIEEIVSQNKPMLVDLEVTQLVKWDDLDEGILHLNQILSYLQYMKAAALHGKAGVADVPAFRKKEILTEAYDAAATSVTLFRELTEGRDEQMYSKALILQANLAARLGTSSSKQLLDQARVSADEAIDILRQLGQCPAPAYRVLGVISQQVLKDYRNAMRFYLKSIKAFKESGMEYESCWCAVAHYNVYTLLQSKLWLKRACQVREIVEPNSPYCKMYRQELDKLLEELNMAKIPASKPVTLTKQEYNEITETLAMIV